MDHANRLDGMLGVGAQACLDHVGLHTAAPALNTRQAEKLGPDAKILGHLLPERGEVTSLEHQDRVARTQGVRQCGFPCARTGSGIDHDRLLRLEYLLDPG